VFFFKKKEEKNEKEKKIKFKVHVFVWSAQKSTRILKKGIDFVFFFALQTNTVQ